MRTRIFMALALTLITCLTSSRLLATPGINTVRLSSFRSVLLADGKHSTDITATVRDSAGRQVSGNILVSFTTTAGLLSSNQAFTDGSGVARIRLTSASNPGVAHVVAIPTGGTPDTLDIEFTDDPSATYNGNNYMTFGGKAYLAYSTTDRVIECTGPNGGARMAFRNFEVTGDQVQYRCDDGIMRAHGNVILKRGKYVLNASKVFYSLVSGEGYAIAQDPNGTVKSVKFVGDMLVQTPISVPPPSSYMNMPALQVKLIIVAVGITYFPNDKLQFRRPKFYQDTVQILKLPYYELALHSDQLFTDQFISVGTSGFGLELPFYYNLTPTRSGEVILRHQQQIGRGVFSYQPGWAIDVVQSYNSVGDKRYEGAYGFTGLTRNDWDFRWNHSQEFGSNTQTSFDVQFPRHESVYADTNITQQFSKFRWGANLSAGRTFLSDQTYSTNGNLYLETQPKSLLSSKSMLYTVGTTFLSAHSQSLDPNIPGASETREGINFHTFSRPIQLDKHTTFTNSFTLGNTWAGHEGSGVTSLATLALDHSINRGGSLNVTYDLVIQPGTFYDTSGRHRISASYTYSRGKRMSLTVFGSGYLDSTNASLLADLTYRLDSHWRVLGSATLERFSDLSYKDFEMTLGRRIGTRELQLTYSTYLRRISFDFTATRF